MKYSQKGMVNWGIQFFTMTAALLLALRVVLRFFNGNPDAQFVGWVINTTNVLLEPFRAVFTSLGVVERGWVVDFPALFAMAVYGAAAYWLMA
ncbi:YggT family protein, partial [Candidatus Saccharibacteria bacterium]|nr:YggT family protein [Candidatus Saccharibacteria bacterium]